MLLPGYTLKNDYLLMLSWGRLWLQEKNQFICQIIAEIRIFPLPSLIFLKPFLQKKIQIDPRKSYSLFGKRRQAKKERNRFRKQLWLVSSPGSVYWTMQFLLHRMHMPKEACWYSHHVSFFFLYIVFLQSTYIQLLWCFSWIFWRRSISSFVCRIYKKRTTDIGKSLYKPRHKNFKGEFLKNLFFFSYFPYSHIFSHSSTYMDILFGLKMSSLHGFQALILQISLLSLQTIFPFCQDQNQKNKKNKINHRKFLCKRKTPLLKNLRLS